MAKLKPAPKAKVSKPAKAAKPAAAREASKKAMLIEMLRRAEGATAAQIAKETGWQHHTIRGAISTLRSKQGLAIETTQLREVGPNKVGGRGSTTIYKIPA